VHELVSARDQVNVIHGDELHINIESRRRRGNSNQLKNKKKYLVGDTSAEEPAGTSWRHLPSIDILGVRPHEVAKGALVRDFLNITMSTREGSLHEHSRYLIAGNGADLIKSANIRREATMDAKDATIDELK